MKKMSRFKSVFGLFLFLTLLLGSQTSVFAWVGMPTPPLHIVGNQLRDPAGNAVRLHGWMQPQACFFNGHCHFHRDPSDWTDPSNIAGLLAYKSEVVDLFSDTTARYGRNHGWFASYSRLNTDNIGGWSHAAGLYNMEQFDGWIENFIVPYANHLRSRGMYLVISAVGPINTPNNGTRNAGVVEGQRLRTFWQRVANNPGVKNADNIMFELMNEPVEIESAPGNGDWGNQASRFHRAFRDWIQPVIDDIRSTGANNIIWVPTLDWQGSPHQWVEYPFSGENIGIAAHLYPAYGGAFDDTLALQRLWDRQYQPAVDRWPMIMTETFWHPFPNDPMNLVNGTTAGFGNTFRRLTGENNVSYLIGFVSCLLDSLNYCRPQECDLSYREGSQAFFSWQPEYARRYRRSHGARSISGRIEAERFESNSGTMVGSNQGDLASRHLGYINQGDWVRYLISVPAEGNHFLRFRVATGVDVNNSIVVRNRAGTTLGTLTVDAARTNGWHDWYVDSVLIPLSAGEEELTFEFAGTSHYLFNIDWFEFSEPTTSVSVMREFETEGYKVWSAPNPFIDEVTIFVRSQSSHENLKVEIYSISGERVFASKVNSDKKIVVPNSENWRSEIHYIVLSNNGKRVAVRSLLKID